MLHNAEQPIADEFFLQSKESLDETEQAVISFLDRLEFMIWAIRENGKGNRLIYTKIKETRDLLQTSSVYAEAPIVWDETFDALEAYTIAEDTDWWQRIVKKHNNGGIV